MLSFGRFVAVSAFKFFFNLTRFSFGYSCIIILIKFHFIIPPPPNQIFSLNAIHCYLLLHLLNINYLFCLHHHRWTFPKCKAYLLLEEITKIFRWKSVSFILSRGKIKPDKHMHTQIEDNFVIFWKIHHHLTLSP